MKAAFLLNSDCGLESTLVPSDTPMCIAVGTRVLVTRPLLMEPHATIEPGEQGVIDYIDERTGFLEILMDTIHDGLHHWRNHIWLMPFGSEDIIDGIICQLGI